MTIQETEIVATGSAAPESPPEQPPSEEGPPAPPDEATPESAPTINPLEDWDTFIAHTESDEFPLKAKWVEHANNLRGEGWAQANEEWKPAYSKLMETATEAKNLNGQATEALGTLLGRVRKFTEEGNISEESLINAFRSVPNLIPALNAIGDKAQQQKFEAGQQEGYNQATFAWAEWVITEGAKEAGKPALAQRLVSRINAAKQGQDNPSAILMDFVKEVKSIAFEAGKKAGQGASAEAGKVSDRDGKGPASAVGESAGGRPTPQQYNAATREQRAKWREDGVDPL